MNLKIFKLIFVYLFLFGQVNLLALEMTEENFYENPADNRGFAVGLGTADSDDTLVGDPEYPVGLDDATERWTQNFESQESPVVEENIGAITREPQKIDEQGSAEDNSDAWSTTAEFGEEEPFFELEDNFSDQMQPILNFADFPQEPGERF